MCGLVGVISHATGLWKPDIEMFMYMLLLNSMRGAHSTGIFGVDKNQKVDYIKRVGGPSHLLEEPISKTFFERSFQRHQCLFGHGRFATVGTIDAASAHPFVVDHITLIHNGTLTNFKELKARHNLHKVEVDSHLCAHLISKLGPEEAKKELAGAYAFIWYDSKQDSIFVWKNWERPLFLFNRQDKAQFLFSSEQAVFAFVKDKFNIHGVVQQFDTDKYYQFPIKEDNIIKHEFPKPPPVHYPTGGPANQWARGVGSTSGMSGTTSTGKHTIGFTGTESRVELDSLPDMPGVREGAWIPFWVENINTLQTNGSKTHHAIQGWFAEDLSIVVRVLYKGEIAPFENEIQLIGHVKRILKHFNGQHTYSIICDDVDFDDLDIVEDIAVLDEVVFMNDVTLKYKEAVACLGKGCVGCKKPLKLSGADFISIEKVTNSDRTEHIQAYCLNCANSADQQAANGDSYGLH